MTVGCRPLTKIVYAVAVLERLIDNQALSRDELTEALRRQMNELRSELRRHGIPIASRVQRRTDKEAIVTMARKGMRAAEIARHVGLTRQRISVILNEAGIRRGCLTP